MDSAYLRYLLEVKGIHPQILADEMGWSQAVCYRRRYGLSDWIVPELKKLSEMGFSPEEIKKIFFTSEKSEMIQE